MAINIGPKIGIDGEAAFRNEIKNIAQQLKVLDSEMKIVTNSFKNNGDEQAGLIDKSDVLTKQIEVQKKGIEELKKEGMWFVCADMGGDLMYNLNLTGPMGVVIGNEGEGVSRLVKEKCDFVAAIPMKGDIDSLNASVAAGILAYEVVRQRMK